MWWLAKNGAIRSDGRLGSPREGQRDGEDIRDPQVLPGDDGRLRCLRQTTDVAAISRYTGYNSSRIQKIKNYLFHNREWTGADPDIAAAWHRLRTGAGTPNDRLLLKHETAETLIPQALKERLQAEARATLVALSESC